MARGNPEKLLPGLPSIQTILGWVGLLSASMGIRKSPSPGSCFSSWPSRLILSIAIGYPVRDSPAMKVGTEREPLSELAAGRGFDDGSQCRRVREAFANETRDGYGRWPPLFGVGGSRVVCYPASSASFPESRFTCWISSRMIHSILSLPNCSGVTSLRPT
jgi:hypothetical protein